MNETLKQRIDRITNGGQGSGCHGSNCGRKPTNAPPGHTNFRTYDELGKAMEKQGWEHNEDSHFLISMHYPAGGFIDDTFHVVRQPISSSGAEGFRDDLYVNNADQGRVTNLGEVWAKLKPITERNQSKKERFSRFNSPDKASNSRTVAPRRSFQAINAGKTPETPKEPKIANDDAGAGAGAAPGGAVSAGRLASLSSSPTLGGFAVGAGHKKKRNPHLVNQLRGAAARYNGYLPNSRHVTQKEIDLAHAELPWPKPGLMTNGTQQVVKIRNGICRGKKVTFTFTQYRDFVKNKNGNLAAKWVGPVAVEDEKFDA
jgi:hypothetical protein